MGRHVRHPPPSRLLAVGVRHDEPSGRFLRSCQGRTDWGRHPSCLEGCLDIPRRPCCIRREWECRRKAFQRPISGVCFDSAISIRLDGYSHAEGRKRPFSRGGSDNGRHARQRPFTWPAGAGWLQIGLCPIAESCVSVRHASALLPFGFEGVDDEHDDPFSLKERE